MKNYQVSTQKNMKFCPYPGCEEVNECKQTKMKCTKCERDFCSKCKTPWHVGKTCAQAQKELYKDWVYKFGAHQCPKCKTPIEKNAGCPNMNCTQCQYTWCWVCGRSNTHWTHSLQSMNLFGCKVAPSSVTGWVKFILTFILGLIFMPLYILIAFSALAVIGTTKCLRPWKRSNRRISQTCRRRISWIPFVFIWILLFLIVWAACLALGAVFTGIFIVPIYLVHIYQFLRTAYWWSKPRENAV